MKVLFSEDSLRLGSQRWTNLSFCMPSTMAIPMITWLSVFLHSSEHISHSAPHERRSDFCLFNELLSSRWLIHKFVSWLIYLSVVTCLGQWVPNWFSFRRQFLLPQQIFLPDTKSKSIWSSNTAITCGVWLHLLFFLFLMDFIESHFRWSIILVFCPKPALLPIA